ADQSMAPALGASTPETEGVARFHSRCSARRVVGTAHLQAADRQFQLAVNLPLIVRRRTHRLKTRTAVSPSSIQPGTSAREGMRMSKAVSPASRRPWYSILYVQVVQAIALGILLGYAQPKLAVEMKPLGDAFIKLIKMAVGLVIFFIVVSGIGGMQSMKKVGRVGGKALIYFEVVSTLALLI